MNFVLATAISSAVFLEFAQKSLNIWQSVHYMPGVCSGAGAGAGAGAKKHVRVSEANTRARGTNVLGVARGEEARQRHVTGWAAQGERTTEKLAVFLARLMCEYLSCHMRRKWLYVYGFSAVTLYKP